MIKIFNANDRDFSTAGNIIIEPTKCREFKKKSLNGWYIEVEMPIMYKDYIEKDKLCVVKTKSKLNPQAFRIGENITYTNRKISFTANHVMFDAVNYLLLDVRPTNLNGINTLNYINERTDNNSPFKMFSNIENVNTAYFIRKNLLEAWATIEERWNGVFDADNWNISFLQSVGNDNGETIIYGKNMQSMEIFEDWSNVVTKLYPVGYDGIMLPEKFIESDVKYEVPYTKTIDFQTDLEKEEQIEENLINELRTNAHEYLEENKYPKVSYTTKSDINNNMEIGDTIQVLHPLVEIKTEVLEYEYDLNSEKIKSLTFGNFSRDVKAKFDNIKNTINQLNQTLSNQLIVISKQTDLINSLNKNGYVYIDDNEILILDAIPKEQAKNVWRFGLGGIGFSSNGYEGPFELAITMDGQINAKFITTGSMSVSRIEGLANKITEYDRSISNINLDLGKLTAKVEGIEDLTRTQEGSTTLILGDCTEGDLLELHIYGNNSVFGAVYLSDDTYLDDNLVLLGDSIIRVTDKSNNMIDYDLNVESVLRKSDQICDEFVLEQGQAYIIRRINVDGSIKEKEEIEDLGSLQIRLKEGTNKLEILNYIADLKAKFVIKSNYTEFFTTKVEMDSKIELEKENINIKLSKKTDNDKIIASINMSTEKNQDGSTMQLQADKISLQGKTLNLSEDMSILSKNFNVSSDGTMSCRNAKISGIIENGTDPLLGRNTGKTGTVITSQGDIRCMNLDVYTASAYTIGGLRIHPNDSQEHNSMIRAQITNDDLSFQNEDNNLESIVQIGIYGNTHTGYIHIDEGKMSIKNGVIFLNDGELNVGHINASGYGDFKDSYVRAQDFINSSEKKLKKNIYKLNSNSKNKKIQRTAIEIINDADICEYNFKNSDTTTIGLVVGSGYKTPDEILSENKEGINLYSMISVVWRAMQETIDIINKKDKDIENLQKVTQQQNNEIKDLKERLKKFEKIFKNSIENNSESNS